jgi:hypothetical protein
MTMAIMALDETHAHAAAEEPLVATPSLEDLVRQRAHEIWLARGCEPGFDVSNWLEAEEQILRESK